MATSRLLISETLLSSMKMFFLALPIFFPVWFCVQDHSYPHLSLTVKQAFMPRYLQLKFALESSAAVYAKGRLRDYHATCSRLLDSRSTNHFKSMYVNFRLSPLLALRMMLESGKGARDGLEIRFDLEKYGAKWGRGAQMKPVKSGAK